MTIKKKRRTKVLLPNALFESPLFFMSTCNCLLHTTTDRQTDRHSYFFFFVLAFGIRVVLLLLYVNNNDFVLSLSLSLFTLTTICTTTTTTTTTTTVFTQSMCSGSTSMPKFLFMNSYVVQQIAEAGTWKRTRAVAPENKARRPSRSATCLATLNALAEA